MGNDSQRGCGVPQDLTFFYPCTVLHHYFHLGGCLGSYQNLGGCFWGASVWLDDVTFHVLGFKVLIMALGLKIIVAGAYTNVSVFCFSCDLSMGCEIGIDVLVAFLCLFCLKYLFCETCMVFSWSRRLLGCPQCNRRWEKMRLTTYGYLWFTNVSTVRKLAVSTKGVEVVP